MQSLALLGVAAILAGCQIILPQSDRTPTPAGPQLECRGVPHPRCEAFADGWQEMGFAPGEVVRVVVTCTAPRCDDAGGEVRVELLLADGELRNVGGGGYSTPTEVGPEGS